MPSVKSDDSEDTNDLLTPGTSDRENMTSLPLRASVELGNENALSVTETQDDADGSNDGDLQMPDFTEPSVMQTLGNHSRELIRMVQKIEALNISAALPSLPKFVVIGDQSAGKSSIIEAVCDVALPRSDGTCTRCPFKITTSATDGPWTCKIELQKLYTRTTRSRSKKSDSNSTNWVKQPCHNEHFVTVYDKDELGDALRRAQLAILNPLLDHTSFVEVPIDKTTHYEDQGEEFSPNVIHLMITAPDLPELSFYDLPGAVSTFGDESKQHLVDFIEKLLKSYIQDEGAFLLLACPANLDIQVSLALRLLRDCVATERSLLVLTKPDLMEKSEVRIRDLKQLLVGSKGAYRFGDGCFVTLQRSQKQLDGAGHTTYEQIRKKEAEFFNEMPWSTELADYSSRFGTVNLQKAISQKLTAHILRSLPEIARRVLSRLEWVEGQLSTFPAKATAPHVTVQKEIFTVTKAISEQIDPDSTKSAFREPYRNIFRNLSRKLVDRKPVVILSTPGYVAPSISLDSSEDESPSKRKKLSDGSMVGTTPAKKSSKSGRHHNIPSSAVSSGTITSHGVENEIAGKVEFSLNEVKARFDSAPGADIPGQASEVVVRALIIETLYGWPKLVHGYLKQIGHLFSEMLDTTIDSTLAQFSDTQLCECVKQAAQSLLQEALHDTWSVLENRVEAVLHRPISYGSLFKQLKDAHEATLQEERRFRRVDEHFETMGATTSMKAPSKAEQRKKAADITWVHQTIGSDEYDREIRELAKPLAYYEFRSASLVDCVAQQAEFGLIHRYDKCLLQKLLEDLQTENLQHCEQLLATDPARELERKNLEEEKNKLVEALSELQSLPGAYA